MSNHKTNGTGPQVGRENNSESHTGKPVCLKDSGGGKYSTMLHVGTYNIRSMNEDAKLHELEEELTNIQWDVIGLSEIRRKGEQKIQLNSGNMLYYKGNEENSNNGVGFIINKRIVKYIQSTKSISDRVAYIMLKLKRTSLKIIQVYAPTSTYNDEDIESFYDQITLAMEEKKTKLTLIIGDFNAKLGKKLNEEETRMGQYGYGERNERGHTLMNYLEERQLFAMNSFFNKKTQRKWTWISPNGNTKNEIDYILSTQRTIIKDITVLNRFSTGSDHRLVRAKLIINSRFETTKKMESKPKLDMEKLKQAKQTYKSKITESIPVTKDLENKNIDEINTLLTDTLVKVGKEVAQTKIQKENYISQETKNLMNKRRTLLERRERNTIEYKEVNKTIRKNIKESKRRKQEAKIEKAIQQNKNMKCLKPQLGNIQINSVKNKEGNETSDIKEIIQITQEYYTNLYDTKQKPTQEILKQLQLKIKNVNSDIQPEISKNEITKALKGMKNNKSPGRDGITVEMLKNGGKTTTEVLYILMNKILSTKQIPNTWNEAITLLLFKKGDRKDLKNYRPITLLNVMYKLLTKILTNRLTTKLDNYQAREQAGFRKGFSTSDHLLTMKILIEKANEYQIPLYMAFIDFEKAFDSVEHWAVKKSLQNGRIDYRYTDLISNIYDKATTTIKLMEQTEPIKINRGVRQGDTISPKLFNQALEDVFKKLHWDNRGIKINGQYLNHLRYADDIVVITDDPEELQRMMEELDRESTKVGLKMNYSKTKTMTNQQEELIITVAQESIEQVKEYIYLGQIIKPNKENQTEEIKRRIRLAWASFGKLSYILKNKKYPQYQKTRVFNQCILPVLIYGAQTWTFTKENMERIAKTERSMERQMLNIRLTDRKRNEWIRNKTKVRDVSTEVAKLKWKFAGHTIRQKDDRWNKIILQWRPWSNKRKKGRPQMRWSDDLKKHAGVKWTQTANDREAWRKEEEAYVQRWMFGAV